MKKVVYPILAAVVFVIMQAVAGVALTVLMAVLHPSAMKSAAASGDPNALTGLVDPTLLSITIVLSGILTIVVIALLRMIDWKNVLNIKTIDWKWGLVAVLGAIFGIFGLNILEEIMDLPNLMEDTFTDMSHNVAGALCIGVLGPVIEEFIFREGIEGYMLRNGVNKWAAIIGSALAFGVIHLNPAQVPFAAAMGVILGIIYYKSGNIVLTSILHILNNSVAVWQMYTLGDKAKDFKLVDWLGGTPDAWFYLVAGIGLCILWLTVAMQRYEKKASSTI